MFLDDTACNLASINLMKFREDRTARFDVERFKRGLPFVLHCTGDSGRPRQLSHASDIAANSHLYRPLGLGYSNLGSLIMASGLPYDSDACARACAVR